MNSYDFGLLVIKLIKKESDIISNQLEKDELGSELSIKTMFQDTLRDNELSDKQIDLLREIFVEYDHYFPTPKDYFHNKKCTMDEFREILKQLLNNDLDIDSLLLHKFTNDQIAILYSFYPELSVIV